MRAVVSLLLVKGGCHKKSIRMRLYTAALGCLLLVHHVAGQVQVRLADGLNPREGRVELFYEGEWGTVCDDGWDNQDAAVICRMVGFSGFARALVAGNPFGPGRGIIHLKEVSCDGNEASIDICSHGGWGSVAQCSHAEDAAVTCLGDPIPTTTTSTTSTSTTTAPPRICNTPSDAVRLVNGPNEALGQVQVLSGGQWYAVCDDMWGQAEAAVVCRMLCYNPTNARAVGNEFGNVTESFLLDDVDCEGDEDDIMDCNFPGLGVSNCDFTEAAGVSCLRDSPTPPPLPSPEVECSDEKIVAKFARSLEPDLLEEHLNVTEGNYVDCSFDTAIDGTFVTIAIPFTQCSTARTLNRTDISYSNVVRFFIPPEDPTITRREVYYIPVTCVLPRNGDPSNEVEPEGRTARPQFGDGEFNTYLNIYTGVDFNNPVQTFPVQVPLAGWVAAAVVLNSNDPNLKVIVPRCWTTPEIDMDSMPQRDLILDRCSVEDSVTFYPINETMFAFRFQSFKFIGANYSFIYLHCKAFVCGLQEKDDQCDRTCDQSSRRRRDLGEVEDSRTVFYMEKGPFVLTNPNTTLPGTSLPVNPPVGAVPSDDLNDDTDDDEATPVSSTSVLQVALSLILATVLALLMQ